MKQIYLKVSNYCKSSNFFVIAYFAIFEPFPALSLLVGLRFKKFFSFDCIKVYNIFEAFYIVILHFSLQSPENKCIIFCRLKYFCYFCSVKSSFK